MRSLFLRSLFQNIAFLTPMVTSLTQTCISCIDSDRKMKNNSKWKFELKCLFLKPLSQNHPWWRHRPENASKTFKSKEKLKGTLRWIIHLWNYSLKILTFWLNVVRSSSTQNWLERVWTNYLVSNVLMVIERLKSKVKKTLRWGIRFWISFLKIFRF